MNKGLTFIELLVIIAILGVIGAVVAANAYNYFGCSGAVTNETIEQRSIYGQLAAVEMQGEYMTFYLQGGVHFTLTSESVTNETMPVPAANSTVPSPFDSRWTYVLEQVDTRFSTIIYELVLADWSEGTL